MLVLLSVQLQSVTGQDQQDPRLMNGGSILAMAGKECLALAVDKRFASSNMLVHVAPRPVLHVPNTLTMVAFTGLEGDVQALRGSLAMQIARKYSRGLGFRQSMAISTKSMASLTSHVLYQRKQAPYYVEPLVVGLDKTTSDNDGSKGADAQSVAEEGGGRCKYRPFLCSMDMAGAVSESKAFVCCGAATNSLYGTCEALWRPDLSQQELLQVCGKAFLSALERDCLSGYGAVIYLVTPSGIEEYDIIGRND